MAVSPRSLCRGRQSTRSTSGQATGAWRGLDTEDGSGQTGPNDVFPRNGIAQVICRIRPHEIDRAGAQIRRRSSERPDDARHATGDLDKGIEFR